jgi:hypothetical protein
LIKIRASKAMARQNCLEFPAMPYAASYFAALVFFLAVDIAWITTVMRTRSMSLGSFTSQLRRPSAQRPGGWRR